MLRLYLDEDAMDQALVLALRSRGIDVVTARDEGMLGRSDREQLEHATSRQRTLCTYNVSDFWSLHIEYLSAGQTHAGVILMSQQRMSIGECLRRLLRLCGEHSPESMRGHADHLSAWARDPAIDQ